MCVYVRTSSSGYSGVQPAPLATAESKRVMVTLWPATIPAATKDRIVSASTNVDMT